MIVAKRKYNSSDRIGCGTVASNASTDIQINDLICWDKNGLLVSVFGDVTNIECFAGLGRIISPPFQKSEYDYNIVFGYNKADANLADCGKKVFVSATNTLSKTGTVYVGRIVDVEPNKFWWIDTTLS